MAWAISPFIIGKIEKALIFDVDKKITELKNQANEYFKNIAIKNIGNLTGNLEAFSIDKIICNERRYSNFGKGIWYNVYENCKSKNIHN